MKTKALRLSTILLVLALLFGVVAPAILAATPFQDVPEDAWFADAVAWAYAHEITSGTTPTTFSPHANVTRGEFVTFLHRITVHPDPDPDSEDDPIEISSEFSDVTDPNRFFFEAVNWAADNEIVTGWPDGTFRPNAHITRQELATMLYRFAEFEECNLSAHPGPLSQFTDHQSISDFAITPMRWATNRGIVQGRGRRIHPRNTATRAESLTMLYRYVMTDPETEVAMPPPPQPSGSRQINSPPGFPAPNRWTGRDGWVPDKIVLHTAGGSTQSAIHTAFNSFTNNRTSYHFIISSNGTITQLVPITDTAWANGTRHGDNLRCNTWAQSEVVRNRHVNANLYTISISFGEAGPASWIGGGRISQAQIEAGAWLIQHVRYQIWELYGLTIPVDRTSIIGHRDINPRTTGINGCPGPSFPFDTVVNQARQY